MSYEKKPWKVLLLLTLISLPILIMYLWLFIDSFSQGGKETIWPTAFTLKNWRFLYAPPKGHPSIWPVTLNTFIFSISVVCLVICISAPAGYALSRLKWAFRGRFLGGLLLLHSFPSITLIIAIFVMLQAIGLYNSLIGVILVKASLELPLGIWVMKGFYDSVPWEIEMAGLQDGANRIQVWYKLILPQIKPGIAALSIFSFIAGWSEYVMPLILAPGTEVQTLSVYLASLLQDDYLADFRLFKAVGLFYMLPVIVFYLFTQEKLMHIYSGGTKS